MIVANKTIDNLVRAIVTRVYLVKQKGTYVPCPKPTLTEKVIRTRLNEYKRRLCRRTRVTPAVPLEEIPGLYCGSKRAIYQHAVDSLLHEPYNKKDSCITAHTKVEKIEVCRERAAYEATMADLFVKDPRVIQARTPRYNANLGRFLKLNEKRIFAGIDRIFQEFATVKTRTVMKGLNATQRGQDISDKWNTFINPVAVMLDASRFDEHVSRLMLEWEHSIYLALFRGESPGDLELLEQLLRHQVNNNCSGYCKDGKIKYRVVGNRMSGDMNTGLGNVIIMTAMMYRLFTELGCKRRNTTRVGQRMHLELVNDGDDCVILCEREQLQSILDYIPNFFMQYGFEMSIDGVTDTLEKIKFCQCSPIYTPRGYIMVRNVRAAMAKDAISILPINNSKQYNAFRGAVAGCGLALTAGIPISQAWYEALGRKELLVAPTQFTTGMHFLSRGLHPRHLEIHPDTRVSFYEAFGVLPDHQIALEEEFAAVDCTDYQPRQTELDTGFGGVVIF